MSFKGGFTININAEFHCHSLASDGTLSPKEVIAEAKKAGISLIALTDHDITSGLDEAKEAAKELDIQFIPGIELSCEHKGSTVHVLGYFRDDSYKSEDFQKFLNELKDSRIGRAKKIVANLEKYFNIKLDYKDVLAKGKGVVARPHIAQCIIEAGYPYDWEYIFDNFIGNDSPAYVPNKKISVQEGINILKANNAITVLAHPKLIKRVPVQEVMEFPFDGIEAIYYQNTKKDTDFFISYAVHHDLLITCGSDFHGDHEGDERHGHVGCMSMPKEYLEKFLKKYNCNKK
nr:PHP domain-containing protein [Clostridium perfringens]BDA29602.1 phosphatase [Clostridium perfringens]